MSDKVSAQQLQTAKATVNAAMAEAHRLEDLYEQQTVIPTMRRNVGRCFKYRNSSSSDESWWMYLRIADVNADDAHYRCLTIQQHGDGVIGVEYSWWAYRHHDEAPNPLGPSYLEISPAEFKDAVRPILARVNDTAGGLTRAG